MLLATTAITFKSAMLLGGVLSVFITCTLGVVQIGWYLFQKKRSNGSAAPQCQFDPAILESSQRRMRMLETGITKLCQRDEGREKLDEQRERLQAAHHAEQLAALKRIEEKL